jgi:hypothetical protein
MQFMFTYLSKYDKFYQYLNCTYTYIYIFIVALWEGKGVTITAVGEALKVMSTCICIFIYVYLCIFIRIYMCVHGNIGSHHRNEERGRKRISLYIYKYEYIQIKVLTKEMKIEEGNESLKLFLSKGLEKFPYAKILNLSQIDTIENLE